MAKESNPRSCYAWQGEREIARTLGRPRSTVIFYLDRISGAKRRWDIRTERRHVWASIHTWAALDEAAEVRGVRSGTLLRRIIETVIGDKLICAVLDDRDEREPRPVERGSTSVHEARVDEDEFAGWVSPPHRHKAATAQRHTRRGRCSFSCFRWGAKTQDIGNWAILRSDPNANFRGVWHKSRHP